MSTSSLRARAVVRFVLCAGLAAAATAGAAGLPEGYWGPERAREILGATVTIRLAPDLSALTAGERRAVTHLLRVGALAERLYEDALHPEALSAAARLDSLTARLGAAGTSHLRDLYRISQGPIATTLDNRRVAFMPVAPEPPTRNVYPAGATREEIEAFLERHPDRRGTLLAERTVVRRATRANLDRDLAVLAARPALDVLHPGLRTRLEGLRDSGDDPGFYAVPHSVRWADEIAEMYDALNAAADAVEGDDPEFARYLRNRARDLLSDDYESGDASWVTGRFQRLDAQIGAYETYDDPLFGAKAFMSVSLLVRDAEHTARLRDALRGLQAMEDALPYGPHKRVREDIPVGVYDVIADFGQARSANTATILPNDPLFSQRYGRTILLRGNIMRDTTLFANARARWAAAVAPAHVGDLTVDGRFDNTLWHEVGHYLGPDRGPDGRPLDDALGPVADLFEEMKSDLVSLHGGPALVAGGYYDEAGLRAHRAAGILRVLQVVRPREDQPYGLMTLMQFNWFIAHGLLDWDAGSGRLTIRYDRYQQVITELLHQVLAIQSSGDPERGRAFVERWTDWTPKLHGTLAERLRGASRFRFVKVTYEALGD